MVTEGPDQVGSMWSSAKLSWKRLGLCHLIHSPVLNLIQRERKIRIQLGNQDYKIRKNEVKGRVKKEERVGPRPINVPGKGRVSLTPPDVDFGVQAAFVMT